jgi:cbb3-type cytochrome oxidase maturation protein
MNVLVFLIPISLILGGIWLGSFLWASGKGQWDDPEGDGARILNDDYDDHPKE